MNCNNIVTVIIPVYNVENYIRQCIESVLNQTHKQLEIILVDDGSKDSSGAICDEYSKKDNRIKVIHKENGGLSSARNTGIECATGKYMMFVDSDDFLEINSCEILYKEIEDKDTDYVIGNYIYTTYDGVKWEKPMFSVNSSFEVTIDDYEKSFFVMNSTACNKIFKREFIEKHKLRFVEGAIAEDAIFTTYCYTHTERGYYTNHIIYNYRQNKENKSISTNCNMRYFKKMKEAYKLIYDNFYTTNHLGFYRFFCARIMPYFLCKIIDTNELDNVQLKEVLEMFSWYFKQRDELKVVIINNELNKITTDINEEDLDEAMIKIKETKRYRQTLNSLQKEKMYAVSDEVYNKMLEKK